MWNSIHPAGLAAGLALAVLALTGTAAAEEAVERVSGPYSYENLAIYLIHGPSAEGPVPLTLEEAMTRGHVRVDETGTVSQLTVENLSDEEVFIQSGDIVKGGRQDRVLTVSMILKPRSGVVPVGSYCVEAGRWSARGAENVKVFASSTRAAPSRELKLALKSGSFSRSVTERLAAFMGEMPSPASGQGEVWRRVAETQAALSRSVGAEVAAAPSPSSLQLALENDKLKETENQYQTALQDAGAQEPDVIGYAFAINGRINSADLYPSNGLFRKMWPKMLRAAVTEAIASERAGPGEAAPAPENVRAFLDSRKAEKADTIRLSPEIAIESGVADNALFFATRRANGGMVHLNYIAR